MKRNSVAAGVFVFVAFFFLSPFLAEAQPGPREERSSVRESAPFLKDYLELTSEQVTKLEELRKSKREERQTLREQIRKARAELRELMRNPQAEEKEADAIIEKISDLEAARLKSSFRNIREMRTVLTPEQVEKLENIRDRMAARRDMSRTERRGGRRFGYPSKRWF